MICLELTQISQKSISLTFQLKNESSKWPQTMIQHHKKYGRLPQYLILDAAVFVDDTVSFLNENLI